MVLYAVLIVLIGFNAGCDKERKLASFYIEPNRVRCLHKTMYIHECGASIYCLNGTEYHCVKNVTVTETRESL